MIRPAAGVGPDTGLVLVFGASGMVGSALVPRLLQSGCRVRAAARRLEVLAAQDWPGVQRVRADALDAATLPAALRGVSLAYYLVHSMAAGRDFGRLDIAAASAFAAAAAAAGVDRIVYLGGPQPAGADSEHLLSRRETGEALRAGAVPVTELRAGIIVAAGSAAFEVIRDLVNHQPLIVAPRWVHSTAAPIAIDNLLHDLLRLPALAESAGRVYDAGGAETLSYAAMMRQYGALVGRRPRIVVLPALTPALSARWSALVTTVPADIVRALIGGLKHDIPADDAALRRLVPQRLLGFGEAVQVALAAERAQPPATRWIEGRLSCRGGRADFSFYARRERATALSSADPAALWRAASAIGGRWTVIGAAPPGRLTVACRVALPGHAVLEFEIEPAPGGGAGLAVTTYWHPAGARGLVCWYALRPLHRRWLARLARRICRSAEAPR